MKVCNLSSGSDGNLTYIESNGTKILVDIGLSCKETETRLGILGVSGQEINAILITHEHSDHIKGLEVFANRYRTPVFLVFRPRKGVWVVTHTDSSIEMKDFPTFGCPHRRNTPFPISLSTSISRAANWRSKSSSARMA